MDRTQVVIMGAAGRDFHDFNVVYRDDPAVEVVAFTATQIPGIDRPALPAGARRAALPGRHRRSSPRPSSSGSSPARRSTGSSSPTATSPTSS